MVNSYVLIRIILNVQVRIIRVKKSVLVTAYTDLQNGHREKDAKRKCKQNS